MPVFTASQFGAAPTTVAQIFAGFGNSPSSALFWGGQTLSPVTPGGAAKFANTANVVSWLKLNLFCPYNIRKIATRCQTGSGVATDWASCAIYDITGQIKLLDAGPAAFNLQNGATSEFINLASPVLIGPGSFIFAYSATTISSTAGAVHVWGVQPVLSGPVALSGAAFIGTAQNNSGGQAAMPASLGTLTIDNSFDVPGFTFIV